MPRVVRVSSSNLVQVCPVTVITLRRENRSLRPRSVTGANSDNPCRPRRSIERDGDVRSCPERVVYGRLLFSLSV